jgi:DNA modification methylase
MPENTRAECGGTGAVTGAIGLALLHKIVGSCARPFTIDLVKRTVTLQWPGRPTLSSAFAPAEPRAVASAPARLPTPAEALSRWDTADGDRVYVGDNLHALTELARTEPASVTLAYLDPPFLTGRSFEKKTTKARGGSAPEFAFDDHWKDRAEYLQTLADRLICIRELLAPWGSVVIHVDPKTSHYIKVLCDEIFGDDAFASEIVWRYRRWPSRTPNFQRVHDVLLRYRRDPTAVPRFTQLYEPLAASTQATWGTKKQRAVVGAAGERLRSSSTADESRGVPMGDVWDIGVIAPVARERTGYPSQKPEALLERVVEALSAPGDRVLDCYAGSGTTLAVARRLGRSFVGMDASPVAFTTLRARLEAMGAALQVYDANSSAAAVGTMSRVGAVSHAANSAVPKAPPMPRPLRAAKPRLPAAAEPSAQPACTPPARMRRVAAR